MTLPFLWLANTTLNISMKDTILIIGDSWAATYQSSVRRGLDSMHNPDVDGPCYTIDTNLQKLGYEVINKSWYGASNTECLTSAEYYLRYRSPNLPKIKLIIFFCTELLRDLRFLDPPVGDQMDKTTLQPFDAYLEKCYQLKLRVINGIKKLQPNTDWAVIGGHAPIHNIEDWCWAKYTKENWRAEIAGHDLPACHSLSQQNWVSKYFDYDTRMRELHNCEIIENVGKSLFADQVHPDLPHHHALAQEIINHFDL